MLHRVGVHHPGHRLLVGADIGGRDVVLGADQRADLAGVAAGHAVRVRWCCTAWVDAHAALGAAVGDIEQGALPGHPHRQGADLVEGDVGGVAKAALGRSARDVVLHSVPDEQLDLAGIAPQRDRRRSVRDGAWPAWCTCRRHSRELLRPRATGRVRRRMGWPRSRTRGML